MRIGSLFSGIGGLELGLEAALGGQVVWQVEREAFPRRVLAHHWPYADRSCTDVTTAHQLWRLPDGADVVSMPLAPVDLICGGFPCQDISPAGRGAGIHGQKSGLWLHFARLVCNLRPRFVVVENSAALPARGLGTVLGDLASLGYDAEWTRIGAVDVGAPHRRWRTFIIGVDSHAHSDHGGQGWQATPAAGWAGPAGLSHSNADRDGQQGQHRQGLAQGHHGGVRHDVPDADVQRCSCQRERSVQGPAPEVGHDAHRCYKSARFGGDWLPEPAVRRVVDGPALGVDGRARLRALGNAVVPQVAYEVGLRVLDLTERPPWEAKEGA